MTRPFKDIWFVLSAATLALFALFLLYPLLNVLSASLSAGAGGQSGWATLIKDPRYSSAVTNTLLLGAIVTVTSTLIGVPLAFVAARFRFPARR